MMGCLPCDRETRAVRAILDTLGKHIHNSIYILLSLNISGSTSIGARIAFRSKFKRARANIPRTPRSDSFSFASSSRERRPYRPRGGPSRRVRVLPPGRFSCPPSPAPSSPSVALPIVEVDAEIPSQCPRLSAGGCPPPPTNTGKTAVHNCRTYPETFPEAVCDGRPGVPGVVRTRDDAIHSDVPRFGLPLSRWGSARNGRGWGPCQTKGEIPICLSNPTLIPWECTWEVVR